MRRVLALYGKPNDPDHFRRYYEETHIPIARKLPGLKGIRWAFDVEGLGGESPYFCVCELDFESAEALQAAVASPEGQATVADVPNYASGGLTLVHYDVRD
jgi:uncharacterized protein (TIGR02118 family)